ncbi:cutinase-domain-containing protein [Phialemonium atrogriseum]|uniref:Cutinase-domain-containing protein n=1 Tax=Phialemonium atrogriseum TaxID=1093897 RepID=A0AAJ0BX68_9PEZI|nr:cutinase-domain-containing protein [Phialemonium atrogriseum]KAK1765955.1 cutinase-domain-containing protein [Phialemonium atrogriseum]
MARSRSLLSALLLGVLAAAGHAQNTTTATTAGAPATTAPTASDAPCATGLHLIVARGSSEQPGEGRIGVVAGNVTERVPGSTVEAVEYPATLTDYLESEGDGVAAMAALIAAYVGRCPDSRIALLGYSQGGQVAMDVVCGTSEESFNATADLSPDFKDNLVAVVTFGDPSHVPGVPWDAGTSKKAGIFPRENTSACEPYSDVIRGWCDTGDIYCDSGSERLVHGTYFANYTMDAVDFIVGKFNDSRAAGGSGGSSATGSSPSSTASTTAPAGPTGPTSTNGVGSRHPSGPVVTGLLALAVACVALL